jgi:Putative DNA-binding domain
LLLEFQRDFAAAIAAPADGPMRVYCNTVLSGCVEALRANYPLVARLLGDEMFDAVAAGFAAACPPRQPILALYGDSFADWIEVQSWAADVPYLPDLARIERMYIEALFAADCRAMTMYDVAGQKDWEALHLRLHPGTCFDWLTTPALSIWLAQREGIDGNLQFDWRAEGVLVTRPELEVQTVALDRAGHRFLFGIRAGESIGDAAIATANLYPETDIGSLFTSFVNAGVFAASIHRS